MNNTISFVLGLLLALVIFLYLSYSDYDGLNIKFINKLSRLSVLKIQNDFNKKKIFYNTAKGNFSIKQLEQDVYMPLGYKIVNSNSCFPLICVKKIKKSTCEQTYNDWLTIALNYKVPPRPPSNLSDDQMSIYTLNNHVPVLYQYEHVSIYPSKPEEWNASVINEKYINGHIATFFYAIEGASVYHVTKNYNISGQKGMVIGSISPWVEGICLKNGAKELLTVDHNPIKTDHPQIKFVQAIDLAKNFSKYRNYADFVITFSSIEHSGLGRYNDPLDPIGDIREINKLNCLLKPGAKLFLGIPVGQDSLVFHMHRVYGKLRLPLIIEGFRLLDIYHKSSRYSVEQFFKYIEANKEYEINGHFEHAILVLEKINDRKANTHQRRNFIRKST